MIRKKNGECCKAAIDPRIMRRVGKKPLFALVPIVILRGHPKVNNITEGILAAHIHSFLCFI